MTGAEGIRTPGLCRAKALRVFRVRPVVYACVAYIRRFRPIGGLRIPAVFGSILRELLHGCCTRDPSARCQGDECALMADWLYLPI